VNSIGSPTPNQQEQPKSVPDFELLTAVVFRSTRVAVLTGAGCSTASGLGDYRDKHGKWKRPQPITGQTFLSDQAARHRYWARSSVGWPQFKSAVPNRAHHALCQLEHQGIVTGLITQNVDELHQKAGQQSVLDLHGVLSVVRCVACNTAQHRDHFQSELLNKNPWLCSLSASYAPDGDADLDTSGTLRQQLLDMHIPGCPACGNLLKPDVVFFGENVPKPRVEFAMDMLRGADVLLVAGSSLMVYSGFRFCRDAHQRKQPIIILNNGDTRADDIATVKLNADCATGLQALVDLL